MQIRIDKRHIKDVIIITPKKENNEILYFTINIKDEFDNTNSEYTIPIKNIIENEMWYKCFSIYGDRYAQLLCKDDCLVIEYKVEKIDEDVDCNSLIVHYRNYNDKSNCSIMTETYANYSKTYESKYETIDYIFWTNRNSIFYVEFIEFIKYYLQKYPVLFYKEPLFSYYELSRKYYENKDSMPKSGYRLEELNSLFLELFPKIMSEKNYESYYDLQVYNKPYVPTSYYKLNNKNKEDTTQA